MIDCIIEEIQLGEERKRLRRSARTFGVDWF